MKLKSQAPAPNKREIAFTVNGESVVTSVRPSTTLIELIRDKLGLKGTKPGCLEGECGSCSVLVDGAAVNSCLYLAINIQGKELVTVEGLPAAAAAIDPDALDRVQEVLAERGAVQCGFCSPGMAITIKSFQTECEEKGLKPGRDEIKKAIEGNLCRCTGYVKIVEAAEAVFNE